VLLYLKLPPVENDPPLKKRTPKKVENIRKTAKKDGKGNSIDL